MSLAIVLDILSVHYSEKTMRDATGGTGIRALPLRESMILHGSERLKFRYDVLCRQLNGFCRFLRRAGFAVRRGVRRIASFHEIRDAFKVAFAV